MSKAIAILITVGAVASVGCSKQEEKKIDLTKLPNYHANPDPRSYTNIYEGTVLAPNKGDPAEDRSKP